MLKLVKVNPVQYVCIYISVKFLRTERTRKAKMACNTLSKITIDIDEVVICSFATLAIIASKAKMKFLLYLL